MVFQRRCVYPVQVKYIRAWYNAPAADCRDRRCFINYFYNPVFSTCLGLPLYNFPRYKPGCFEGLVPVAKRWHFVAVNHLSNLMSHHKVEGVDARSRRDVFNSLFWSKVVFSLILFNVSDKFLLGLWSILVPANFWAT